MLPEIKISDYNETPQGYTPRQVHVNFEITYGVEKFYQLSIVDEGHLVGKTAKEICDVAYTQIKDRIDGWVLSVKNKTNTNPLVGTVYTPPV
jgi:hypothetical protein